MTNSRHLSHSGRHDAGGGLPLCEELGRSDLYFSRSTLFHCSFVYRVAE